jgi:hypothetical protein
MNFLKSFGIVLNVYIKNKKIYYFNKFLNEKYFEKQYLMYSQTNSKFKSHFA